MHTTHLVHATPDGEELIAYMARVSNPNNQSNSDTAPKLIKYLIRHRHWSPFEMVNMCVCIETTRSIAAQILRHRSFSFQEFSQRYAVVDAPIQIPSLRSQDHNNRQNSLDDIHPIDQQYFQLQMQNVFDLATNVYNNMLDAGIAKECAREVLPLATPTKMYMNGTLRSWLHYTDLRCSNGTQYEHKLIADQCKELIAVNFPTVYAAMWSND